MSESRKAFLENWNIETKSERHCQTVRKPLLLTLNIALFRKKLVKINGEARYYKPEGRGFETDEVNEFFNLPSPSGRIRPWGLLSL
jgi:hypothetical protein